MFDKGTNISRRFANFPVGILRNYIDEPKATLIRGLQYTIGYYLQTMSLVEALGALKLPPSWQIGLDTDICRKVYEQHHGGAQTGIEIHLLIWLIPDIDLASEFEKMRLLCFLGCKSTLGNGKSRVVRTNYRCLFSRMAGRNKPFASDQELLENVHPTLARWYTIRKRRTLLRSLLDWGIASLPGRGVWLGYGVGQKGLDGLVARVHRIRQGKAESNYQAMLKQAKDKIL